MSKHVGAIIVAAGLSSRMGGIDKVVFPIRGVPLIMQTALVFQSCLAIDEIVLVVRREHISPITSIIDKYSLNKIKAVCVGGETRRDSVGIGLKSLSSASWVVVHDGARPLVTDELITKSLDVAQRTGASTAGLQPKDTMKTITSDALVGETLDRKSIIAVQTPQTFTREILEKAHREFIGDAVDDAVMVENLGIKVAVYPGQNSNIKVTTFEDLKLVELLLESKDLNE